MKDTTRRDNLIAEFLSLKNELLKRMSSEQYIYLWQDVGGGSIALGWDNTLLYKYESGVRHDAEPHLPQALISFVRDEVDDNLSDEECLKIANQQMRILIQERQSPRGNGNGTA